MTKHNDKYERWLPFWAFAAIGALLLMLFG
jgi:hypothetical protein